MFYSLAKKLIPEERIARLEHLKNQVQRPILYLISWSKLLCSIYYALCSGAFRREHRAAVCSRLRYMRESDDPRLARYPLRRNIHRLEKGLLMRPQREVFALGYIKETVECYGGAVKALGTCEEGGSRQELQWASDVLSRYFAQAGAHPVIDELRRKFHALESEEQERAPEAAPYKRDLTAPPTVRYDDLLALARRRRSVRWFVQKPAPRELIDQAIAVAALSPSACNRQPFEFRVFDEPSLVQQLATIPMGTVSFAHNFPAIVVVVGKLHAFFDERDRHVIYIDAALATMAFTFALETLGLSSCCINWPDLAAFERPMARILGLSPEERVIMLIALGTPDPEGLVAYSQKKTLDELRSYNQTAGLSPEPND